MARPWRGLRVGTGLPGVILLGRTVAWRCSADFVAVSGAGPALVVELRPHNRWGRLVLSTDGVEELAAAVTKAVAAARDDAPRS